MPKPDKIWRSHEAQGFIASVNTREERQKYPPRPEGAEWLGAESVLEWWDLRGAASAGSAGLAPDRRNRAFSLPAGVFFAFLI